jgi:cellulose synthase/poly-beta-1,6-N-acetylglucosamine synthase-like glycosyltransferase
MKLQLLIPTMPDRAAMREKLFAALLPQLAKWPQASYLCDDGSGTIGHKRDRMMRAATGDYVAFVDDDDMVAPDYLDRIMPLLDLRPDTVGITVHVTKNGEPWQPSPFFRHSLRFAEKWQWQTTERTPHHLCPTRRDLALRSYFPDIMWGEDYAYAVRLLRHLQNEQWSGDEPIYFYDYVVKPGDPKL